MPVDVKKWLEDTSAELGLNDVEKAAAEKLMSNNKFKGDFVALPDFHSALDKQKNTYQAKVEELTNLNFQWQDEYDSTYGPALDAVTRLQKAGYNVANIRNDGQGGVENSRGEGLTAEDVQKMILQAVEPIRAGSIDYSTFITDATDEYREQYGKKFPAAEFRKFGYDNRDKYPTFESAYNAFTEADRKAKEEKDREQWRADEREKIRLELASSGSNFPEAGFGGEGAPAFTAAATTTEPTRDSSRQAFASAWSKTDFSKVTS